MNISKRHCFPNIFSVTNTIRVKRWGWLFCPPRT